MHDSPFPNGRIPEVIRAEGQPNLEDYTWVKVEPLTSEVRLKWHFVPLAKEVKSVRTERN